MVIKNLKVALQGVNARSIDTYGLIWAIKVPLAA